MSLLTPWYTPEIAADWALLPSPSYDGMCAAAALLDPICQEIVDGRLRTGRDIVARINVVAERLRYHLDRVVTVPDQMPSSVVTPEHLRPPTAPWDEPTAPPPPPPTLPALAPDTAPGGSCIGCPHHSSTIEEITEYAPPAVQVSTMLGGGIAPALSSGLVSSRRMRMHWCSHPMPQLSLTLPAVLLAKGDFCPTPPDCPLLTPQPTAPAPSSETPNA